jgi:2-polyprenyl-3-methyl-5-hydroxy-6-metoxy-1,4-benzoquinol methylase
MGALAARFFSYVQGADFYRDLHREAIAFLPPGGGRTWIYVGCGPGLVAQLAHQHGYSAMGVDLDTAMIDQARRRFASQVGLKFTVAGLDDVATRHDRADVISAASLLIVLPDRRAGMAKLLNALSPAGVLLVVETTELMASALASRVAEKVAKGRRRWVLWLWIQVRRRSRPVDVAGLCPQGYVAESHPLLAGLVTAWIIRRQQKNIEAEPDGCIDNMLSC